MTIAVASAHPAQVPGRPDGATCGRSPRTHPFDGAEPQVVDGLPQGCGPADPPAEPAVFSPGRDSAEPAEIAARLMRDM